MEEKNLSEQESLQIITEMIRKAKSNFHESGISAILWGSTIAVCGIVNFIELYWNRRIGFDIWILALVAIIPQIFISIKESRKRTVVSHTESVLNTVWIVYSISIFALIFYMNVVPGITDKLLIKDNRKIVEIIYGGSKDRLYLYIH